MKPISHVWSIALLAALTGALAACSDASAPAASTSAPASTSDANANPPSKTEAEAKPGPAATAAPPAADANAPPTPGAPIQSSYYARLQPAGAASGAAAPAAPPTPLTAPLPPSPSPGAAPSPAAETANGGEPGARYANVISVQPVKATGPHEECRDVRVVHRYRPKDEHQIAGTVIGAVAGGVIGNQVGGGRGRDLATIAGAVGGGIAGKKIQENQQDGRTYTTTEHRCRKVNGPSEQPVAYDVVYEYLGASHQVRMDHDPGDRVELPVRGIE
jgi:uncharacterized protein YcfJ